MENILHTLKKGVIRATPRICGISCFPTPSARVAPDPIF